MCTSNEFADDILQPLALERFTDYVNVCAKHFPLALRSHHYLVLHGRWNKYLKTLGNEELAMNISPRCFSELYVHRNGDIENCTFIAICERATDEEDYFVYPFTLQESGEELDQCFRQTERIKWNCGPVFQSIHSNHMDLVFTLLKERGLKLAGRLEYGQPHFSVWLSKEKAAAFEYEIPSDIYVAPLKSDHANLINSNWGYQTSGTLNFIRSMIVLNADEYIGLFDKNTNEILSYVGTNDNLSIGLLHTVASARGRGLAKLIVKIYCKEFAKRENLDVLAFVYEGNQASKKLLKSLGFNEDVGVIWMKLETQ